MTERDVEFAGDGELLAEMGRLRDELQASVAARDEAAAEREALRTSLATIEEERMQAKDAHERETARLREDGERALVRAEIRAEAARMGAHRPDDLLRLLDVSGVHRGEDGQLAGMSELLEEARRERAYLFGAAGGQAALSGDTGMGRAPRPGEAGAPDARRSSERDYHTLKRQFLSGG